MRAARLWAQSAKRAVHRTLGLAGLELVRLGEDHRLAMRRRVTVGRSHVRDVRTILKGRVRNVFDVGANVGQTAEEFLRAFRSATVFCFEPDPDAYATLRHRLDGVSRVRSYQVGIGDAPGRAELLRNRSNLTNSFLRVAPARERFLVDPTMMEPIDRRSVDVISLDVFCETEGVSHIDVLKMDVQGFELKVLAGAERLLGRRGIDLIYTEVSFVSTYLEQPLFPDVYQYLFDREFRFVGLYESGHRTHYYHVGGNALFVREDLGIRMRD